MVGSDTRILEYLGWRNVASPRRGIDFDWY